MQILGKGLELSFDFYFNITFFLIFYRGATVRKTPTSKHKVKRRCLSGGRRSNMRICSTNNQWGKNENPTD